MNKKLLCAALLLGGLGVAQAASAQEFDDRWYVAGSVGVNFQDEDRRTEDTPFVTLGFGKFLTPRWSVDLEANYQNPDKTVNPNLWWTQYGISADARYHFRDADSKWWPYIKGGLGFQRHEEEFVRDPALGPNPAQHEASKSPRTSAPAYSSTSVASTCAPSWACASISMTCRHKFRRSRKVFHRSAGFRRPDRCTGPGPMARLPRPPVAPSCADLDDDGDGVNNCDDKCPGSEAGQTIGPDGCRCRCRST